MIARKKKNIVIISIVLLIFIIICLIRSKYGLKCTYYNVYSDKIQSSFQILQITDLHNSEFGEDNKRLIALADEQSPDLILITGDLLDSRSDETDIAVSLIQNLLEIAPVYVSYGNHEVEYEEKYSINLYDLYEEAGAVVLERNYEDISVNGQKIRLGGIYGYCLPDDLATAEERTLESDFLYEFQDTELYTLLMCHMPVCWISQGSLDDWSVDCVLSGHVHGGQVIIPFIGGLYAPDLGWFPGKLEGLYYSSDGSRVMVLSRGLGSTEVIPRFNNIPEVVILDINPES
ncbi:MAG: metallophosphoesterase [Lachnospiraceae bacterium]|nr:metallophosphoesterase [Lachnospiraceae bacterium]